MKRKWLSILTVCALVFTTAANLPAIKAKAITGGSNMNLVWDDEFNGNSLNTNNWTYDTGAGGWGNNELEDYTNRAQNVSVQNGNLVITAQKESYGGESYTSGRIKTEGLQSFTYGKIEAKIKLPAGQGLWPAFWLLGSNINSDSWPECGEIDAMEHVNNNLNVAGSAHWYYNGEADYSNTSSNLDFSQYHIYDIVWDANSIKWYVDNQLYSTLTTTNIAAYQNPFFIVLNLAVGGNWPGNPDGTTQFPSQMLVDYVRVYQGSGDITPTPNPAVSPVSGATNVPLNSNLLMNFSENVTAASGENIYIKKASDNSIVETIPATSTSVSANSNGTSTVTIAPTAPLSPNTAYYVQSDPGAFVDIDGNPYAGISDNTTWGFTTATNPSLISFSPASASTNVAANSNLLMNFNESVTAVSEKNIYIKNSSDNSIVETIPATSTNVSANSDGTSTVTITPSAALSPNTAYYVQVDNGAFADVDGNPYAGIADNSTWSFTTATSPTVISYSPAAGSTNVAVNSNLIMNFNKSVTPVSGKNIYIKNASNDSIVETIPATSTNVSGSGTSTITITPSAALSFNTTYYIQVDPGAFVDTYSDQYAGIADTTTWDFTTNKDTVATPTATPDSCSFSGTQNVTLSSNTSGASLYYTTDDTTPTDESTLYIQPISLSATTTLKVVAIRSGMNDSAVATFVFTDTGSGVSGGGGVIAIGGGGSGASAAPTDTKINGTSTTSNGNVTSTAQITAGQTDTANVANVVVNLGNVTVTAPASVLSGALGNDPTSTLQLSQEASPATTQAQVSNAAASNSITPISTIDIDLTKTTSGGATQAVHLLNGSITVVVNLTNAQIAQISDVSKAKLYYYNTDTGALTDMGATFDLTAGTVTFNTNHFSTYVIANDKPAVTTTVGVTYASHVQHTGWQSFTTTGSLSGTTGKSLRDEAVQIKLTGNVPSGAAITYQTYVQNMRWQKAVSNGAIAGTIGKSLRLEALRITLKNLSGYEVKYRAYVQSKGWLPWQTSANGTDISKSGIAGTTGKSLRIESIEVQIVKVN
jgi:beta-glucanase (GH16 family)